MKQIGNDHVSSATPAREPKESPLSLILANFPRHQAKPDETTAKKKRFNSLLAQYIELTQIIEKPDTAAERNKLFYANEDKWRELFDELNRLRFELGKDGYSWEFGYDVS